MRVEQVVQDGKLFAPAGDARVAMIDPRDVGEAAAALLIDGGHEHETVLVTGPTAVTFADAASACGGEFVDVPEEEAPPRLLPLFRALRAGAASQVTDTVERLTGSPSRSLAEFVRETGALVA